MAWRNSLTTYGTISKTLHWLIAFFVIVMVIGGFFMNDIPNENIKHTIVNLHRLLGIAILLLMLARLVWRLSQPRPDIFPAIPTWQKAAALTMHSVLYTLILLMPLTGWIMSTAAGHFPHIGALTLPLPFIIKSKAISSLFFSYHQITAWVIIALISLHALGAISHRRFGP